MLDEKFEFRGTLLVACSASKVAKQAKTDEVSHNFSAEKKEKKSVGVSLKLLCHLLSSDSPSFFFTPIIEAGRRPLLTD